MAKIVFVPGPEGAPAPFFRRLLEVLEEGVGRGRTILILADDPALVRQLDESLWMGKDDSFLPHSVLGTDTSPLESVVIAKGLEGWQQADVVFNFTTQVIPPSMVEESGREVLVCEVVLMAQKEASRHKWNQYKERQVELSHRVRL